MPEEIDLLKIQARGKDIKSAHIRKRLVGILSIPVAFEVLSLLINFKYHYD